MAQFSRGPEDMEKNSKEAMILHRSGKKEADGTNEKDLVYSTAFMAARNFAEQTNIPYAKEIYLALSKKMGFNEKDQPKLVGAPHFLELRYLSTEKVLAEAVANGEARQVLELASGFTPHSINVCTLIPGIENYIENDFEVNLRIKQELINEQIAGIPVKFCSGNILEEETWDIFEDSLRGGPVAIFSEGLIMYLSDDELIKLLKNVARVLSKHGGFFLHEDMLKYHPELRDDERFSKITAMLKSASKNEAISDARFTQEGAEDFYEELGFVVDRIPQKVEFSYEKYPEDAKLAAEQLKSANFRMWKLTLSESK